MYIPAITSLKALTQIKTKNELIGEVIGLLQSPAKSVYCCFIASCMSKKAEGAAAAAAIARSNTDYIY